MFEQFNGNNKKLFNVTVDNPVYTKLSAFNDGDLLQVLGMYINKKSVYGEEPIFILKALKDNNIYFVNMPKIHLETLNIIINNAEMVNEINNGNCFVKVVKYFNKKYKKDCNNVEFTEKPENTKPEPIKAQGDVFTTQDIKETQECIF